jgi:signal transduction histidine kinase
VFLNHVLSLLLFWIPASAHLLGTYSSDNELDLNNIEIAHFRLAVPMATRPHLSIFPNAVPERSSARLLLVEDERIVALDLADTLNELGYKVVGNVSSGEAAIEHATKLRPDLVLMDIRLHGTLDGIQTTQAIRKELDVPVIYLTAHSDDPTLAKAKNTGPFAFLIKPFKAPELRCAIEIALHKHAIDARLRATETRLRQAEKLEAVARLSGGIAHEFNNLMAVVLGYAALLEPALAANEQQLRGLQNIQKTAKRAANLTRQLLAFSRSQVLSPQVLDLNSVLSDISPMLVTMVGEGTELAFVPAPDSTCVQIDPAQLHQVLVNLISNAKEAMPAGGKITIELGNAQLQEEDDAGLPQGDYATLTITDTGPGMTPEVKARAFEPFFTTKEIGQGPGLGLAAVHGIVSQSGGSISVKSQPGAGTTFKIYLPRLTQKPGAIEKIPGCKLPVV